MARYTYNAGLVTQTIDTLYAACDCLDNTNVDIKKGIDMIWNARGAENMNIDFSPITGYQETVVEHIETMATEIKKKATEIEEYQDAPWYKKLFATIGMGALKLVEGLATFVENIGDGLVSIVGFIGGIFSSEFKNSVAEFVRTDYVGETTAKWYEEGWLKDVNKYSYMSHESTAANVLKGVGTAAGYVILTVATAGAGGAIAAASTGISAGAAALGGIGSGTQNALKQAQLANPEMSAGEAFNSAFGQGVKQGAIAAGTTLLTAGIAKGLQGAKMTGNGLQFFDDVVTNADDIANLSRGAKILNSAKQGITKVGNTLLNNRAGLAVIEGIQTVGGTAVGGAAINAAAPLVGASSQFKKNAESTQIDNYIEEVSTPSVAQQLYEETQEVLAGDDAKPGVATEEEAAQNLDDLKEQGYNPGSGSPETPGTETPGDTNGTDQPGTGDEPTQPSGGGTSTPTPGNPGTTTPKVTAPPADIPDYPGKDDSTPTPGAPDPQQPKPTYPTTDDVVSKVDPVNPGGGGGTPTDKTPGNGGVDAVTGGKTSLDENSKETVSSEVLNTFGDVSGSFAGLSGSKTSIPSSSSPILSSTDGQSSASSFVPLGAGLGAASIAGIGAKAYMDKREKSKETESDDIETEEWAEKDNVEIDYGVETTEEADYLSPADELAFTE